MNHFLTVSGAIAIAIMGAIIISFPFMAIFGIIGYLYIKEQFEEEI